MDVIKLPNVMQDDKTTSSNQYFNKDGRKVYAKRNYYLRHSGRTLLTSH